MVLKVQLPSVSQPGIHIYAYMHMYTNTKNKKSSVFNIGSVTTNKTMVFFEHPLFRNEDASKSFPTE